MKIKEVKVVPYMKVGYCEKCGAKMVPTGSVFLTCPAIYQYKCYACGNIEESREELNEVYYKYEEVPVP